jgi:hypothetical protein
MRFFLGTHHPAWLAQLDVPLFVSRRTLADVKALPRARGAWALDSGGFTELSTYGRWTVSATEYARQVRRFRDEIGGLAFAAPRDFMCEPAICIATGLSVEEHQERTVADFLELRALAPDLPWIPVLQGWGVADYWRCHERYERAGVDLKVEPLVGVGTVCRRQSMTQAGAILSSLAADGLKLHGFGFKKTGLRQFSQYLASADSLAWSLNARKNQPLPGHTHASCANCQEWALLWRDELLGSIPEAA